MFNTPLQKMIGELEAEILEQRAIIVRTGAINLQKLETENSKTITELEKVRDQLAKAQADLSKSHI